MTTLPRIRGLRLRIAPCSRYYSLLFILLRPKCNCTDYDGYRGSGESRRKSKWNAKLKPQAQSAQHSHDHIVRNKGGKGLNALPMARRFVLFQDVEARVIRRTISHNPSKNYSLARLTSMFRFLRPQQYDFCKMKTFFQAAADQKTQGTSCTRASFNYLMNSIKEAPKQQP